MFANNFLSAPLLVFQRAAQAFHSSADGRLITGYMHATDVSECVAAESRIHTKSGTSTKDMDRPVPTDVNLSSHHV